MASIYSGQVQAPTTQLFYKKEAVTRRGGFLGLKKITEMRLVLYKKGPQDDTAQKVDGVGRGIRIIEKNETGKTVGRNFWEKFAPKHSTAVLENVVTDVDPDGKSYEVSTASFKTYLKKTKAVSTQLFKVLANSSEGALLKKGIQQVTTLASPNAARNNNTSTAYQFAKFAVISQYALLQEALIPPPPRDKSPSNVPEAGLAGSYSSSVSYESDGSNNDFITIDFDEEAYTRQIEKQNQQKEFQKAHLQAQHNIEGLIFEWQVPQEEARIPTQQTAFEEAGFTIDEPEFDGFLTDRSPVEDPATQATTTRHNVPPLKSAQSRPESPSLYPEYPEGFDDFGYVFPE